MSNILKKDTFEYYKQKDDSDSVFIMQTAITYEKKYSSIKLEYLPSTSNFYCFKVYKISEYWDNYIGQIFFSKDFKKSLFTFDFDKSKDNYNEYNKLVTIVKEFINKTDSL